MKSTSYIMILIISSLLLVSCSNLKEKYNEDSYFAARQGLRKNSWKSAIKQLKELDSSHPLGTYSHQVQLDLIYAYYKNGEFLLAQDAINHFIHLNLGHPNTDYAIYMRGLTNMALDKNILQSFFGINRSSINPHYARSAFEDFSTLINYNSGSKYTPDAARLLNLLENRLAKYELSVASHYAARGAWNAVVIRAKNVLVSFPNSQESSDALILMKNAYLKLKMTREAEKIEVAVVKQ